METTTMPLKGVKVMDLSIYVAGPACSSILGYMGADVIKIEPVKGDPYRLSGRGYGVPAEPDMNPICDSCNGYKRGIAVDFRSDEGKEILRRIASSADIIVTNYRDKALKAMGMDYEEIRRVNPKVVYGYFSGYGTKGPEADRPGFDATTFFSRSGFAMRGTYKNEPPMATISAAGDSISSLGFCVGILGAYIRARETGVGDKVLSSLYGNALWVMGISIAQGQFGYVGPFPKERPGFIALSCDYECSDHSWIRICGMSAERYWGPLCKAIEREDLTEDARFATSKAQHDNLEEARAIVQAEFIKQPYEVWAGRLSKNDVPFERNCLTSEISSDEQAWSNGYLEKVVYENGQDVALTTPPFSYQNTVPDADQKRRGPYLGEDTRDVLTEYGFTSDEIDVLIAGQKVLQWQGQEAKSHA